MLDKDKAEETARAIEKAALAVLGDNHLFFGVHSGPARELAEMDLDKLKKFVSRVEDIRQEQDEAYEAAKQKIGEAI